MKKGKSKIDRCGYSYEYDGELNEKGEAHGLGVATLGGEWYEGYFKNGMFDGIGVHYMVSCYYVGEFKENLLFGKVTTYDYWERALDNSI